MVDFYGELSDVECLENFGYDRKYFRIWDHRGVIARNIKVTLIELSETTLVHLGLVTAVDLSHVEALDLLKAFGGDVAGKWHSQIIAKC